MVVVVGETDDDGDTTSYSRPRIGCHIAASLVSSNRSIMAEGIQQHATNTFGLHLDKGGGGRQRPTQRPETTPPLRRKRAIQRDGEAAAVASKRKGEQI